MADLTYVSPSPQYIVLSTPTYLLHNRSVRRPEFSIRLGGGVLVFEPLPPCAPPPPPLLPLFPRHPTPSADYNLNVLCRIPGHRLALIPSLIITTTNYVLYLEHEPLRRGAGINKHIRDRPCPSPDSEGASIYFILSAVASCLLIIVTSSTIDCCSFHSWSVPNFFLQVDLDPFLIRILPCCTLLNALGVILL